MTYVKIKQEEKANLLPLSTRMVLAIRGLFACATRILCGVAFFAPFLGLGNTLAHWMAELKSLSPKMMSNLNSGAAYWNASTVSALYRSDYTNPDLPIPVPYTAYTVLRLRNATMVFLGLLLLQSLFVWLVKRKLSPHFKCATWTSKIQHLMITNIFPDSFKDWDFDGDNDVDYEQIVNNFKKARCAVGKEIKCTVLLQFITNLAFLTPLLITGKAKLYQKRNVCFPPASKVKERHEILLDTIGVFPQETEAFDRLTLLSWLLPAIVGTATLVDLLLILLYLYILHPWRVIFHQVGKCVIKTYNISFSEKKFAYLHNMFQVTQILA